MSTRVGRLVRGGRFDVLAAALGLALAVLLLPLQFVVSQVYIRTLPIVLGIASLLYLLATREDHEGAVATVGQTAAGVLPSVSFLGMALLVVVATVQGGRTLLFYDVAAGVGTAILAQILFVRDREFSPGLVLLQVVVFAAVVRFMALYTTPGYTGIDVWTHVPTWADQIRAANSLAPIGDEKYYASPLFHLQVVAGSLLLDLPLRQSLFLTVGLAMPLSALFIYSTTRLFTAPRWATFATAVFAMSASVVEWGIHLIPTSLGLVFFLAVLYSLSRMLHTDYDRRDLFAVVFFSVVVILTHQISSFIMLVFTGSGLLAHLFLRFGPFAWSTGRLHLRTMDTVNLSGLLAFDLGLITFMWSLTPYKGSSFLATVLSYFRQTLVTEAGLLNLASSGGGGGAAGVPAPPLIEEVVKYVDAAGFLLVLFLMVIASLYVLHREHTSHAALTAVVATGIMLVVVFGFPMFGIRTFVPGRWFAFVTAPMAVLAAIGLAFVARRSRPGVALAVMLVFVTAFPAVSLVASEATQDAPAFDSAQTRYSYSEQELAAVRTIGQIRASSGSEAIEDQVSTDHPYGTVFHRTGAHEAEIAVVQNASVQNQTVIHREYQRSGAAYFEHPAGFAYSPPLGKRNVCSGRRDVTYDNGPVELCTFGG